ncbi:hypothetical protein B0H19DRAFT_1183461 [Mycena capillaripes]|nr:hypothetical protein B0H19DRAFT_1183461 [Mycena capillaripes]
MFHRYSFLSLSPLFCVLIFILSLHILPPPIAVSALPPRLARPPSAGGSPSDYSAQYARQTDCVCHPFAVPRRKMPRRNLAAPTPSSLLSRTSYLPLPHRQHRRSLGSSRNFARYGKTLLPQFYRSLLGEACASVSHCQVYPALQSTQHLSDDHVCERDRFQRTYVECFSPSK